RAATRRRPGHRCARRRARHGARPGAHRSPRLGRLRDAERVPPPARRRPHLGRRTGRRRSIRRRSPGRPHRLVEQLYARFVRPRGEARVFRQAVDARAREDISIAAPLTHFMRAVVEWSDDGAWLRLTGPQGSGLLTSMARANALAVIPPERTVVRAGETVRAL